MASSPTPAELERVRWLSRKLDAHFVDPLLGFFVPGLGDFLSSGVGAYLVYIGWKGGASKVLLARMLANLAIDAGIGSLPIIGDLFDVFFRANQKNLRLLERPPQQARANRASDSAFLAGAGLLFVAALSVPLVAFIALLRWAF